MIDSCLWMDWIMVWNPFNLRCSLPIGSFCQSDPKHGFVSRSDFILFELSSLLPSPLVLLFQWIPQLICPLSPSSCPVSQSEMFAIIKTLLTHRNTNTGLVSRILLPLKGSMERCCCRGSASPRQPWCGRSHRWATKHFYLQSAEHGRSGPPNLFSWMSSMFYSDPHF